MYIRRPLLAQTYGNRQLSKARHELRTSRLELDRLKSLLDHLPVGVHILDKSGKIVMVNATEADMLGRPIEQLLDHSFLEHIPEEQRAEAWQRFQQKLNGEQVSAIAHRTYSTGTGDRLNVYSQDQLLANNRGEVIGILTVLHNITELNEIHQQNALQEKTQAVGYLAAGVAHNFNNLLAAIVMAAEMIKYAADPDSLNNMVQVILDSVQRGQLITNRVLGAAGKAVFRTSGITDPAAICQQAVSELRQNPAFADLIVIESYQGTGRVKCDPRQLDQVISNIMVNAAEAFQKMPDRAERDCRIKVSVEEKEYHQKQYTVSSRILRPGTYAKIVVEDNGPGIAEEIKDKIWLPFYSGEEMALKDGLGLPQSLGLVESFGGGIKMGKVTQGARFVLLIPLHKTA